MAGCPEASICNIYRAVQAAQKQGSLGVIIAHWSGSFHLTPHPFSLPGFVVGAGLAWNASTHWVCHIIHDFNWSCFSLCIKKNVLKMFKTKIQMNYVYCLLLTQGCN